MTAIGSQAVCWWAVHVHVAPMLASVASWPMIGTPAWCALPACDDRRQAALLDAAQHWALRLECCQLARRQASRDVAAGTDWTALATEVAPLDGVYVPRRRTE